MNRNFLIRGGVILGLAMAACQVCAFSRDDVLGRLKEIGPVPVVVGEIGWYMPKLARRINPVLNALPETVPNCRCVSAAGLGNCDEWHFDLPATRTLGARYYEAWRELLSLDELPSVP